MKVKTAQDFGILLRLARRRAGHTQAQVAAKLHATQAWVSAVENGKDTVELGQVLRLAALLRVSLTGDTGIRAPAEGSFVDDMRRVTFRHARTSKLPLLQLSSGASKATAEQNSSETAAPLVKRRQTKPDADVMKINLNDVLNGTRPARP
ncbi:MAG: helix-turn-helix domain-containing protein [Janthinobacterium lividum]